MWHSHACATAAAVDYKDIFWPLAVMQAQKDTAQHLHMHLVQRSAGQTGISMTL